MATYKVRYLVSKPGAGGSKRWFWQPAKALRDLGWQPRRLKHPDGRPITDKLEAFAAAEVLNQELDAARAGVATAQPAVLKGLQPGSVAALIVRYKTSDTFKALRPKTRRAYKQNLDIIADWIGELPVAAVSADMAIEFYDKLWPVTPAKANAVLTVLRLLYTFARGRGGTERVTLNPFQRLQLKKPRSKARIWPATAVKAFAAEADRQGWHSIATAVLLNEWFGQREGDILALDRAQYRAGVIHVEQSKTGAHVELPVDLVPELKARLEDELARVKARKVASTKVIVNEHTGRPFNEHTFRHLVAAIRKAALRGSNELGIAPCPELEGLQFMQLRHTAVTRLAEAEVTVEGIASITGHSLKSCTAIIDRYLVRTRKLARDAFKKRLAAETEADV